MTNAAGCAGRSTPPASVFAPSLDERASALPFHAPTPEQKAPAPRLFVPALSKKASTLPPAAPHDEQKSIPCGARSLGSGASSPNAAAFCSGAGQKNINAAALPLHPRAKKPCASSRELLPTRWSGARNGVRGRRVGAMLTGRSAMPALPAQARHVAMACDARPRQAHRPAGA